MEQKTTLGFASRSVAPQSPPALATLSTEAYPASALAREGVHQGLDPIVHEHGGVEQELLVAVVLGAHLEGVGHERVPVVELVELHGDTVAILELGAEQQLGVKLQPQEVAAQLLHVFLNHNLDGLPWEGGWGQVSGRPQDPAAGLGKQAGS